MNPTQVPIEHVVEVQRGRIASLVHENTLLEALVNHLTTQVNTLRREVEELRPPKSMETKE